MMKIENLPVSPITLRCPFCGAKHGEDCERVAGVQLGVVHVARVKAAAMMDKAAKGVRQDLLL
jgi:hypothetical protein